MTQQIEAKTDKYHLFVKPGETVLAAITLHNHGLQSQSLEIRVEGVPAEWLFNLPPKIYLLKGAARQITFNIQPPLSPRSKAGYYPLKVIIGRTDAPLLCLPLRLTVGTYGSFKACLHPQRFKVGGVLQVAVENQGNISQNFTLVCRDNNAQVSFCPSEGRLVIPPGKTEVMEFKTLFRRTKLFGATQTHRLSATVYPGNKAVQSKTLIAQVQGAPLLPYWTLTLATALLLVFGLSALFLSPLQKTTAAPQTRIAFINNTSEPPNTIQRVAAPPFSTSYGSKTVERGIASETATENRRPAAPATITPPAPERVAALPLTLPASAAGQTFVAALPAASFAVSPESEQVKPVAAAPSVAGEPATASPPAAVAGELTAAPPVVVAAVTQPITDRTESVTIAALPTPAAAGVITVTAEIFTAETTTAPAAPAPTQTLSLEISPVEKTPVPVVTQTLSPPPVYGAALIPRQLIIEGAPGQTLTCALTLQNQGDAEDTFTLSLTLPPGWNADYPSRLSSLPGGAQQPVSITLTLPPDTPVENGYPFTLTAASLTDLDSVTSLQLSVYVPAGG
jgi:hypothetical protein